MDLERPRRRAVLPHERRVFLLALFAGLPGVVATLVLLKIGGYSSRVVWTFGPLVAGVWFIVAFALRERVVRPLQTLSNMLAALREGDFSLRARFGRSDDALGLALMEINMLGDTLRHQRLGAMEATALLRAVMQEIDVAIFAFDGDGTLRLANRAGERLLAQPAERLIGKRAELLGLAEYLDGIVPRVSDRAFPERNGRWEVRRTTFRQDGRPHTLVVVTDVRVPCARRSCWHGSAWCASSATRSTTRSHQLSPWPAAWPTWSSGAVPTIRLTTSVAASR